MGSFVFWATKRVISITRVRESNGGAMFSAFFLKQKMGEPCPAVVMSVCELRTVRTIPGSCPIYFIDIVIPMYILWYMNTHTILNVKTDKKLKADAQKVSAELGVPLSTVINAFLKQFVRDKEITLSANQYRPTPYLESILEQAQKEYEAGDFVGPFKTGEDFVAHLKTL